MVGDGRDLISSAKEMRRYALQWNGIGETRAAKALRSPEGICIGIEAPHLDKLWKSTANK